jgi:hypothetical protein
LEDRQSVEKEQRLVWGAFFAAAPDVDGGEAAEEDVVPGLVGLGWHGALWRFWVGSFYRPDSRTIGGQFEVVPWFSEGVRVIV